MVTVWGLAKIFYQWCGTTIWLELQCRSLVDAFNENWAIKPNKPNKQNKTKQNKTKTNQSFELTWNEPEGTKLNVGRTNFILIKRDTVTRGKLDLNIAGWL